MKTILASLLVSVSLLSPALSDATTSHDTKKGCQTPAQIASEANDEDWALDSEYKNVTEENITYSSIQVFSNKKYAGSYVVFWYINGCVDDSNQVSSEFLQRYVKQYVK
jgi:hypothetical protein